MNCPEQPLERTNLLSSLARHDRPQERLEREGPAALADHELLAIILRSGTRGKDVLSLTSALINQAGSMGDLLRWGCEEFIVYEGIGKVKALQLSVLGEIAKRATHWRLRDRVVGTEEDIYDYFRPMMLEGLLTEKVWVMALGKRRNFIRCSEVASGTAEESLFCLKSILQRVIAHRASAFYLIHNHPSGDPTPSRADRVATLRLKAASEIVELEFLGHVIMGLPEIDPNGLGFAKVV